MDGLTKPIYASEAFLYMSFAARDFQRNTCHSSHRPVRVGQSWACQRPEPAAVVSTTLRRRLIREFRSCLLGKHRPINHSKNGGNGTNGVDCQVPFHWVA